MDTAAAAAAAAGAFASAGKPGAAAAMPPTDIPIIMHDGDRYEHVRDIGSGNFGVARLMRSRATGALVAVKYIERGDKVILTPTHLAIVMEYASGGELFTRISNAGRFSENEARFFFQQLISGVSYCHSMQICHRDLKLENTLLDGSTAPRLKICDFGYSKSALLHSQPKSTVGTPAYIAPELLMKKEYNGKIADVWSCGVTLYVMLVGRYPFEDSEDPKNVRKTFQKIMGVQYAIPDYIHVSPECRDLLSRIFIVNPDHRITMAQIIAHPWFVTNLPIDIMIDDGTSTMSYEEPDQPLQNMDEIMQILAEATIPPAPTRPTARLPEDLDMDEDSEDSDSDLDTDSDSGSSGELILAL